MNYYGNRVRIFTQQLVLLLSLMKYTPIYSQLRGLVPYFDWENVTGYTNWMMFFVNR
ncbi:hypothetical protein RI030_11400 [Aphanizomenon flos-aquae NRERC-008]|jgi:tryptophan-rich sensory protein|uniref:hypothetical protein n=1 Tax=Aphanizomenon TaxID=1175 RepID=UPI00168110A8|nr:MULTISPECIES: hypothetical protein [Aphanizomenon]MCE2906370.1 hypothetical protein [Anabaena sp. CoA2_C59]MDJ0506262.1 hypothetical protein [Nostocales cyanobacterium LE14-WE12]MDS9398183.1 hypothetical protein [Aphanizomenon flos-aquae NRERC-008]MBD2630188.1 hypothetical protein [Aphanizomenon sp. FACHB-1399]MBD2658812.1 hypothetical protein [Aphanizomenon flos-aquae FACHB-1265]